MKIFTGRHDGRAITEAHCPTCHGMAIVEVFFLVRAI